jgi:hypothetical protein
VAEACSTWKRLEMFKNFGSEIQKKSNHLKDTGVDGKTILKQSSKSIGLGVD